MYAYINTYLYIESTYIYIYIYICIYIYIYIYAKDVKAVCWGFIRAVRFHESSASLSKGFTGKSGMVLLRVWGFGFPYRKTPKSKTPNLNRKP